VNEPNQHPLLAAPSDRRKVLLAGSLIVLMGVSAYHNSFSAALVKLEALLAGRLAALESRASAVA